MSIAMRIPSAVGPLARERPVAEVIVRHRPSRWRKLGWTGTAALVFLPLLAMVALVGPQLWTWTAFDQHMDALLQEPSLTHPLGTDEFGRDILARLLLGARWSLAGAAGICAGTSLLGFVIAALATSGSRKTDAIVGRVIEAMMSLPGLVTALAFAAILGASFSNLLLEPITAPARELLIAQYGSDGRIDNRGVKQRIANAFFENFNDPRTLTPAFLDMRRAREVIGGWRWNGMRGRARIARDQVRQRLHLSPSP